MSDRSRREFLGVLAAAASARAASAAPDLILHNATIHTMDPANPRAEAVAIARGRFFAVGTNAEIGNFSPAIKRVDLGGKTVVPGFIDAHLHAASSGLRLLQDVNCDLRSISEIQEAIRQRAAQDARRPLDRGLHV